MAQQRIVWRVCTIIAHAITQLAHPWCCTFCGGFAFAVLSVLPSQATFSLACRVVRQGVDYVMEPVHFKGIMIQAGQCIGPLTAFLELPLPLVGQLGDLLVQYYGNTERSATKVKLKLTLDPFSTSGKHWLRAMRRAMAAAEESYPGIGTLRLAGMGGEQLDASAETFAALPLVVGVTLAIVCFILVRRPTALVMYACCQ